MTKQECQEQADRIEQFNRLSEIRNAPYHSLDKLTRPDETGPYGQGPFTSNTRESRTVQTIDIHFSKTVGGAEATTMQIGNLSIPASEFGAYLVKHIRERIDKIDVLIHAL